MKYYPVFIKLAGRQCLVVGGGIVAENKVNSLLEAGAQVRVISPESTAALQQMAQNGEIEWLARRFERNDAAGNAIVFGATGNADVDRDVAADAARCGVLVNIVDRPELCDFIAPAVVRRDDLTIAISTSGTSPAMARQLRQKLEAEIGPEYALALQLLGNLRQRLKDLDVSTAERSRIFADLVGSPLLDYLRARRFDEVDALVTTATRQRFSLDSLDLDWSNA